MNQHLRRLGPGMAPGGLVTRVVTSDNTVLAEHPLHSAEVADAAGEIDTALAHAWLDEHRAGRVFVYAYDGDSGECLNTMIVSHDEIELR